MSSAAAPDSLALSVVMLTPDSGGSLRRTLAALAAQSAGRAIEIVFVAPVAADLRIDAGDLAAFGSTQVVEIGPMTSTSAARAAGVHAARAPLVAFAEDHCFPMDGWADALIEAHRSPWAGVGPVVRNANPETATSWANLLLEYGPWLDPIPAGEYDHIPGHNSSYKRDVLLTCGDALPEILEAESILQWHLRGLGHCFAIEPAARTCHENFSKLGASFPLRFHGGRLFAASRAREWSGVRRALYTCAAPLIPVVRLLRTLQTARRVRVPLTVRLVAVLALLVALDGIGELAGYATGSGGAMRRLTDLEFHRERYV